MLFQMKCFQYRLVPLVHKALLPLRILRLVTSIELQVENPTHATAHAPEKIFQHKLQYSFCCYDLIVKSKKKNKLPEQNKLIKTACIKMHFMSRVFSNAPSLMMSVFML